MLVTHSATAMALCNALLGIGARACTCSARWPTATGPSSTASTTPTAARAGGCAAHNLGAPGSVVPLPADAAAGEASDADA